MLKVIITLLLGSLSLFANSVTIGENPDLTMTWVGFATLLIFIIGYYFVAAEEKYGIDKAKPALFIGTFMFILAISHKCFDTLLLLIVSLFLRFM